MIVEAQLNRIELTGVLVERKVQRFTPAGVPVTECVVRHESDQVEAGAPRSIGCEVQVVGLGDVSRWLQAAAPGTTVRLSGFLAARSRESKHLRLHVNTIEFVEGMQNE